MWRLYALYGILSPFPQRPPCVVGGGRGKGKMKVRGGRSPSSHRPRRAFLNYYFWPVVYPFSCRELSYYVRYSCPIIGQNSLVETHLGKISVQGLLYDNNQTGEILNWTLVKFVAGMVAIWCEEISGNEMWKKGKLNCSRSRANITGKAKSNVLFIEPNLPTKTF